MDDNRQTFRETQAFPNLTVTETLVGDTYTVAFTATQAKTEPAQASISLVKALEVMAEHFDGQAHIITQHNLRVCDCDDDEDEDENGY